MFIRIDSFDHSVLVGMMAKFNFEDTTQCSSLKTPFRSPLAPEWHWLIMKKVCCSLFSLAAIGPSKTIHFLSSGGATLGDWQFSSRFFRQKFGCLHSNLAQHLQLGLQNTICTSTTLLLWIFLRWEVLLIYWAIYQSHYSPAPLNKNTWATNPASFFLRPRSVWRGKVMGQHFSHRNFDEWEVV